MLPQFSAHPLHNTFQQPAPSQMQSMGAPPPSQQQSMKGGYSPLLKRGNSMGAGNFAPHHGNATPGGGGGGVMSMQTGDGGLGRDPSSYPASPIPPPANGIPQNATALGGGPPPPPGTVVQGVNPSSLPHNILVSYPTGVPGSGGKIFLANSLPQERYC